MQTELKTNRASEDLTVVLFKGNGSPRSFRISLAALHRSLTFFGFFLAVTVLGTLTLIGVSLFPRSENNVRPVAAPVSEATQPTSSVWDQFKGAVSTKGTTDSDSELQKEVSGLREDIAKLNSQLDQRKDLPVNNPAPLLSFFGPRSTLIPEADSIMRVRNAIEVKESSNRQIYLDFELHNVDPQQRQVKGYIVALAKTSDAIVTYPTNAFAPSQNIFLDFTRGETFAVSRFRQARANFSSPALDGAKKIFYQILIFGTDGKVLSNIHVEGNK